MNIFRPSIIAGSLKEPHIGWTDSLGAAGGISLLTGLGVCNYINARGDNRFDVIPVDIVTNGLLVTAAYGA